jgi:hypothetical protein
MVSACQKPLLLGGSQAARNLASVFAEIGGYISDRSAGSTTCVAGTHS